MLLCSNYTEKDYKTIYAEKQRLMVQLLTVRRNQTNVCAVTGINAQLTESILSPIEKALTECQNDMLKIENIMRKSDMFGSMLRAKADIEDIGD